ncbi:hypothetical protein [Halopenitus persicus]|uniref:Uncharacterized protein n=1 Tax=Halopenitus persicus TaxID=1048396 RepID=A0A1H3EQV7_9EURY|nr:hypothetical protein [Halopenitus persicus]QHS17657.1 hypothetical protein GWK26_11175 [haloarchaeon 3A1-DGR]SDX80995.1 hypothetical protein SAMN05216564_101552 [Halopenitus persicus]
MRRVTLQIDGGILEWAGQAAALAGTLLLVLFLVALGGIAYKHLRGDGIEWPDDRTGEGGSGVDRRGPEADGERDSGDEEDGTTLRRGDEDDEWKYY